MVRALRTSAVRFRILVMLVAAGLLVVGGLQLRKAPVDALPEFSPPTVEIQTDSLGLSAPEVEQLITVPMEQDLLNGVLGVNTIRSHSTPGVSTIDLVFDRNTKVLDDRQLVQERISQAVALPNVSRPPVMLDPLSSTSRVMTVALSSRKLSAIQLGVLARWTIRPRLVGLPGVANVAIWGLRDRQLQALVDPVRLAAKGVTLEDVVRTTGNAQMVSPLSFLDASTPGTGGFVDGPNQRLSVLHDLPFSTPRDLAQVPLQGGPRGNHLKLGDVATVVEGHQPLIGDAMAGRGAGMLLVVQKLPGANTLSVTHEIDRALDELRPGLSDVRIDTSGFRPADYIESGLGHLGLALLLAGVLMLVAVGALVMRWQAVVATAVAVPLSTLAAVLVLIARGYTVNALVVVGLLAAAGVIVDDVTGEVEAVVRRERAADSPASVGSVVVAAASGLRGSLGYATLAVLCVAAPVFVATGLTGSFVHPIALSFVLAVLCSVVVALLVTPALLTLLLWRSRGGGPDPPLARALARRYGAALRRLLETPRPLVLGACALGLAGLIAVPFLGPPERPSFKDRNVLVRWQGPPGTSLSEMNRVTDRTARQIRALPGIRDVSAEIGRAVTGDRVVDTESSQVWVTIDPSADYDRTMGELRAYVAGTPGLHGRVETYESDRMSGVLAPAAHDVILRVYGQDYAVLRRKADELARVMTRIDGVGRPRMRLPVQQPELDVRVRLGAAQRYGVLPAEIRRQVATLVSGIVVGSLFEEQKVFDVVVRGVPSTQTSVDSVRRLLIDTPRGGHVPLGRLARVTVRPQPADIQHQDVSRYLDVAFPVAGRDVGSVRTDVARHIRDVSFPLEYHAEVVGAAPDAGTSHTAFVLYVLAAAVAVLLLLQAAFSSWRLAAAVTASLPLSLLGGTAVAYAAGWQASIGALAGLLGILAFTLRQAVVMVRHLQGMQRPGELSARNGAASLRASIVRGAGERLSPFIVAAVATAVALAPFAAMGDVAGLELAHVLAGVMLAGLVTSAALVLGLIPAAYLHLHPRAEAEREADERLLARLASAYTQRRRHATR